MLPKWHTYCVLETPNRWEPIVVAIDFAFWHTLQHFWEVIFPFCNTLHGLVAIDFAFWHTLQHFWEVMFPFCNTLHGFCQVVFSIFQGIPKIATRLIIGTPRGPKGPPRGPQGSPKELQDGSKEPSGVPKGSPRSLQGTPRWS